MERIDPERAEMVELVRKRGVTDEAVLAAMAKIDRRRFVLSPFSGRAYDDSALPIGANQTISQPYTVAFMSQALAAKKGSKILEIGTGSGYQAAVLAEMGCRVFTIERHMELHLAARKLLESLGYRVATRCGDGTIGWSEFAPYDGIVVTAAAPDVPDVLLSQLAEGGRLVIPVGDLATQTMRVIRRKEGQYETTDAAGFKFVPLIGKRGWKEGG